MPLAAASVLLLGGCVCLPFGNVVYPTPATDTASFGYELVALTKRGSPDFFIRDPATDAVYHYQSETTVQRASREQWAPYVTSLRLVLRNDSFFDGFEIRPGQYSNTRYYKGRLLELKGGGSGQAYISNSNRLAAMVSTDDISSYSMPGMLGSGGSCPRMYIQVLNLETSAWVGPAFTIPILERPGQAYNVLWREDDRYMVVYGYGRALAVIPVPEGKAP